MARKNYSPEKNVCPEENYGPEKNVQKIICPKKMVVLKIVLVLEKNCQNNHFAQKNLFPKMCWSRKKIGLVLSNLVKTGIEEAWLNFL